MSIEGVALEHLSATYQEISSSSLHSRTFQDATTTDAHIKIIIEMLKKKEHLGDGVRTIWQNKDGCVANYRCDTVLF